MRPAGDGLLLAIDTATSVAVVALGDRAGRLLREARWVPGFRHGEELLARLDALLAGSSPPGSSPTGGPGRPSPVDPSRRPSPVTGIDAIVVGTGPGAFTGLRVGLATAKGLALALGCPVVGIPTGLALLEAAREAGAGSPAALLLPAGPNDRILVRLLDATPSSGRITGVRLAPGDDPDLPVGSLIAVDLDGRAAASELERGRRAQASLGPALLRLGADRLASSGPDDLAAIVPEYVTLPRGVERETGAVVVGPA